ncbi:NADH dehydrogenase (ubiquinone) B18 subunit [Arctopsyche grandis]|uniref:NADH dehydrogenase (ubiquinone) B18 subunit n=1 Tax=Arctopsyche grandis TaxID=121162 RepID=UPI00406D6FCB
MGNAVQREQSVIVDGKPSDRIEPYNFEKPSFDPLYGFPDGRKLREMNVSKEDMIIAKVPKEFRDYCTPEALKYQKCRRDNAPLMYRCHHEKHSYLTCEYNDYVLRMKEFERERRLRAREYRLVHAQ